MTEALYLVQFGDAAAPGYRNGGVAVLETNRVFGGDSGFYYLGTYTVRDGQISASVNIVKHDPSWTNAFGDFSSNFQVELTGQIQGKDIVGWMQRVGTATRLPVKLTWTAALP